MIVIERKSIHKDKRLLLKVLNREKKEFLIRFYTEYNTK
jgi:hypothetical protein